MEIIKTSMNFILSGKNVCLFLQKIIGWNLRNDNCDSPLDGI